MQNRKLDLMIKTLVIIGILFAFTLGFVEDFLSPTGSVVFEEEDCKENIRDPTCICMQACANVEEERGISLDCQEKCKPS